LAQEDVELEVVIVNDASTDNTAQRLETVTDPRIRLLHHARRRGVAATRNTGLAHVVGPWVAFLDDDDLWSPRKLRAQLDAAAAAQASLVYTRGVLVDPLPRVIGPLSFIEPHELRERLRSSNVMPAGASNVIVRTDAIRNAGGFDERLLQLADWDLWLRLAEVPAAACRDVLVAYVQHPENMVLTHARTVGREFIYLARKHRRRGIELDPVRLVGWLSAAELRAGRPLHAVRVRANFALRYRRPMLLLGPLRRCLLGQRRREVRPAAADEPDWLEFYRRLGCGC